MKTENTLENKARFLLHCYAENRSSIKSNQGSGVVFGILDIINNPKNYYSELTPLSQITDEDAVEVAELHYGRGTVIQTSKERYIKNVGKYVLHNPEYIASKIADFLRSKGYALPFHNLSVDELISYGWVKLKEDNQ